MRLGFFRTDHARLHQSPHIGVVAGYPRNLAVADQIETGVANVHVIERVIVLTAVLTADLASVLAAVRTAERTPDDRRRRAVPDAQSCIGGSARGPPAKPRPAPPAGRFRRSLDRPPPAFPPPYGSLPDRLHSRPYRPPPPPDAPCGGTVGRPPAPNNQTNLRYFGAGSRYQTGPTPQFRCEPSSGHDFNCGNDKHRERLR